MHDEHKLILEALDALKRETGLEFDIVQHEARRAGRSADALVHLKTRGKPKEYWIEAKPTVTKATIGLIAQHMKRTDAKLLLVTQYVNRDIARDLHEHGIQFIDGQGNAFIKDPPLHIYVSGNRPQQPLDTEPGAFGKAGLKVIFALLCRPELIVATYREIRHHTEVALATVKGVMDDLKKQRHMIEIGTRERRLVRKKALFEEWIRAYAEKLRPKQLIGRYDTHKEFEWQAIDLTGFRAKWGGETAAYKLTGYLQPEIVTIYAEPPINDLILRYGLRKRANGGIEIREIFWWIPNESQFENVVHPILVYADLMATANARNIETAKMIYDEYILRHLGED